MLLNRLLVYLYYWICVDSSGFPNVFFMWENLWSNRKTWGWNFRYKYPLYSFAFAVRVWPPPLYHSPLHYLSWNYLTNQLLLILIAHKFWILTTKYLSDLHKSRYVKNIFVTHFRIFRWPYGHARLTSRLVFVTRYAFSHMHHLRSVQRFPSL